MLCGRGSKDRMSYSVYGWTYGWQVKLCDPSLTCANLSALEMSIAHVIKRYTNVMFTYLLSVRCLSLSVLLSVCSGDNFQTKLPRPSGMLAFATKLLGFTVELILIHLKVTLIGQSLRLELGLECTLRWPTVAGNGTVNAHTAGGLWRMRLN